MGHHSLNTSLKLPFFSSLLCLSCLHPSLFDFRVLSWAFPPINLPVQCHLGICFLETLDGHDSDDDGGGGSHNVFEDNDNKN